MSTAKHVRVAVVQAGTAAYSLDETLNRLETLATKAAAQGAELVVFPEAFIGGYPKFSAFGTSVGWRTPAGRDEFARYHAAAIELTAESPALQRLASIASSTKLFLVVGVIERDGGTLYCTVAFVDSAQGLVAKHRKLMPTAFERVIWGQGDGSTMPVVQGKFSNASAKVSATICWENYMPLLRMHYYQLGTQIYCAPTVDARPEWQHTMRHIAIEGRCFVLSACQFTQQKDYPADHPFAAESTADAQRDPDGVMIGGGSVIVSPLGKVLAGPIWNEEAILVADLDLDDIVRGQFDLDVRGHYARPDVFNLSVNTAGAS